MERQTMFMGWKNQHCKDVNSPQIDKQSSWNSYQNSSKNFCRYRQKYLKVYIKCKETRITKAILKKKNQMGEIILPLIQVYCSKLYHIFREIDTYQRNRIKKPKNRFIKVQPTHFLQIEKDFKGRIVCATNSTEAIGHS